MTITNIMAMVILIDQNRVVLKKKMPSISTSNLLQLKQENT